MLIAIIIRFLFEKICCHLVARKLILPTGKRSCVGNFLFRVHSSARARSSACTDRCVHSIFCARARTHPCTHCSVHAHAHSPFLYFIMFPLSLCTHILCEVVKNRDEKNRMRGDMNCKLVLSTQKLNACF